MKRLDLRSTGDLLGLFYITSYISAPVAISRSVAYCLVYRGRVRGLRRKRYSPEANEFLNHLHIQALKLITDEVE